MSKIIDNTGIVKKLVDTACGIALNKIGKLVAEEANQRAPVGETGRLSSSYYYEVASDNKSVKIGSSLNYAPYVELGTGPNYQSPPAYITNNAKRGHHDVDPWWYIGEDGEWHLGWFVRARPHLQPAVNDNIGSISGIIKAELKGS